MGEEKNIIQQINEVLREDESICWYNISDLEVAIKEDFDVIILDDTKMKSDIVYSIIKLNCYLLKPVLVLVENISTAEENRIWGIGATDIIKLPLTKAECRKKLDHTYRWKWYYDRCQCHNT